MNTSFALTSSTCAPAASHERMTLMDASVRLLRRTAHSLASTPGGLRFVADSRPWLQGVPGGRQRRQLQASCQPTESLA